MLDTLQVLVLDCQTTGSTPQKGHLLEVGWSRFAAHTTELGMSEIRTELVHLPGKDPIPPQISKMTGISPAEMDAAVDRDRVWSLVREGASSVGVNAFAQRICVVHYARFENRFLRHLHAEISPNDLFPFRFLCTYEIARRLYPDLPSRGLRALAGFSGLHLPELKRAGSQVLATARIWSHLVSILLRDHGVGTLDDLEVFLTSAPPARGSKFRYPMPAGRRLSLPDQPGVYRFLGSGGEVLYVGKATSLKKRVNSYFQKRRPVSRILEMVSQAHDVDVTPLGSSLEAALLEAREIRSLSPPYNKALRDLGQEITFYSADLTSVHPKPDTRHRLGPIPNREPFEAIRILVPLSGQRGRQGGDTPAESFDEEQVAQLARHLTIAPADLRPGLLAEGVELFFYHHLDSRESRLQLSAGDFFAIGSRLLASGTQPEETPEPRPGTGRSGPLEVSEEQKPKFQFTMEEPDSGQKSTDRTRVPDPGEIRTLLENLVMRASRLRRRGRWLRLLAEADVLWWKPDSDDKQVRVLQIRKSEPGEVQLIPRKRFQRLEKTEDAPAMVAFDRGTYDQLRVLSTELRTLLQHGNEIEVVPGPGRSLTTRWIRRILDRV